MKTFNFSSNVYAGLSLLLILTLFTACQENEDEKAVEEFQTEGKISSIVRNPITADGAKDTVNLAKMTFDNTTYDFGEATEGEKIEHTFTFTNTGKVPLVINDAHSTCGCTVPHWPKSPVAPGEEGEIRVEFNTKNKTNFQEKTVSIYANTYPSKTEVYIRGHVLKKQ